MKYMVAGIVCALLLTSPFSPPAGATQIIHRTPQQLGSQSDLVLRGKVQSTKSYWNDKHTEIYTRTRISVDQAYKGAAPASIDIIQIGGTVGSFRVTVHGAVTWHPGEEVLLFAEDRDGGGYRVSGFSQGKFLIERDPATGEPFIRAPRTEGLQILGAPPAGSSPRTLDGVPLDEFLGYALGRSSAPEAQK